MSESVNKGKIITGIARAAIAKHLDLTSDSMEATALSWLHEPGACFVTLYLQGACSTCPSSIATLKAGVERMLREYVPEVREVIQYN